MNNITEKEGITDARELGIPKYNDGDAGVGLCLCGRDAECYPTW